MQRIQSGVTTQRFYFEAPPGLNPANFAVTRARNSATPVSMTSPSLAEVGTNTGLYYLLMDEDMTITAGSRTEPMVFRITAPGMSPVVRQVEIYDDLGDRIMETEGSYTLQQIMSIVLSVLAGITASGGDELRTPNGNAIRVLAVLDGSDNRTTMTLTPSS